MACKKKLGTVFTAGAWKDGAKDTTESGGRKLKGNKALTPREKPDSIYTEGIGSPLTGSVTVLCTNVFSLPARAVPTGRAPEGRAAETRFRRLEPQANVCLDVLMTFLALHMILLSALNFQGMYHRHSSYKITCFKTIKFKPGKLTGGIHSFVLKKF